MYFVCMYSIFMLLVSSAFVLIEWASDNYSRNCLPFGCTWVHPRLSGVRAVRSLVLCVMFVNRCLFFWPLCGLSFDLRILNNTPLVSSNSSCCLTPSDQIFSYIMATANHFWMRWWYPLYIRLARYLNL
jgi:hypothetical protein